MLKTCSKCKIEKDVILFNKNQYKCKICEKEYQKKYRNTHKKEQKQYYQNNKEKMIMNTKIYREYNKEKLKIKAKEYQQNHKKERNIRTNKYQKNRKLNDPIYKLIHNRRTRRNKILKFKYNPTIEDLGCTTQEWRNYIESKFDSNMNWDNYGSYWHLDEIIPCYAWNMTNEIEQKACFHYLNSQPLEKIENISESINYRYIEEKQQFLMKLKKLGII